MQKIRALMLIIALVGTLLSECNPPTETATPPKGPLNTTMSLTAGLATMTNRGSSGGKGGLAALAPAAGDSYILAFPNGEAILSPSPGERFTCAVDVLGNIVKQADQGDMESAPSSARRFTIPEGERWTAIPGRITVVVSLIDKSPALDPDMIVPPQGSRDVEPIPELPTEEFEFIEPSVEEPLPEPEPGSATGDEMELEIWHAWEGTPEEELVWLAVEQFEAQHPDVTLRVLGNPAGELEDLYATHLVAGEPPDLVLLNNTAIPLWATQGWLQPLSDMEAVGALNHILPSALETVRYDDQLWAIPFQASTVALYYNREALPEPPADIDELLAMVDEGYTLAIPNHIYYLYGFVQAYSGQIDANETLRVDRKSIINYLNFARDLIWQEYTLYGPAGEVGDAFAQGEAQMIVDGVWMLPTYREALGDTLSVTLLPYVPEMGSWPEPVLSTNVSLVPPSIPDEERELALTFALFLTEETIQQQIVEFGQAVPVNTTVPVEDPQLSVFLKQATIANPGPLHAEQGLIWDVLQRMQEKVIAEQERVDTAAESAESELRSAGGGE